MFAKLLLLFGAIPGTFGFFRIPGPDRDVFSFSNPFHIIQWVLEDLKSLPVSGAVEFQTLKGYNTYCFPQISDGISGEAFAECCFDFDDEEWHRINFTVYAADSKQGPTVECWSDISRVITKTRYNTDIQKMSFRLDFNNERYSNSTVPFCLWDLQVRGLGAHFCSGSSQPKFSDFTRATVACGCSQNLKPQPMELPNSAETNEIYQLDRSDEGKKGKVEWTVRHEYLPVKGSFEYLTDIRENIKSRQGLTFPLVVYDNSTNETLAECSFPKNSHAKNSSDPEWFKFEFEVVKNRVFCGAKNENQNYYSYWPKPGKARNVSIRFDTENAPTHIRKFILGDRPVAGCPPTAGVVNFTGTSLLCKMELRPTQSGNVVTTLRPSNSGGNTITPDWLDYLGDDGDYNKEVEDAMCLREIFLMNGLNSIASTYVNMIGCRLTPSCYSYYH